MARGVIVPAAAAVLLVAGCGGTTISGQKADALVKRVLTQKPKSVNCPDGLTPKKGATFQCKVVFANGDAGTITLHETNNSGHAVTGSRDIRVDTISSSAATGVVQNWASGRGVQLASINCPPSSPGGIGQTVTCQVADKTGKKATVDLQVANQLGGLRVTAVHLTS